MITFFEKIFTFFFFLIIISQNGLTQSCAIVYHYHKTGNMILREYYCGNLDQFLNKSVPPKINEQIVANKTIESATADKIEIQPVNSLYPNPTTGQFKVKFSEELKNTTVFINDASGKVLLKKIISSTVQDFDISNFPTGTYFLYFDNKKKFFVAKVIKQ